MNYCCPMCGGSTNTAGNCVNCASPVVYTSTTVKRTDYCAEHDTHHVGGCFQCSQRTKDLRIAELEAELALKKKACRFLAFWYCKVHNDAVNEGEEVGVSEMIAEAEAQASEVE